MSDNSHDKIYDKGERDNLVEYNSIFKTRWLLIAIYTIRALPISCAIMPNADIATVSDRRCCIYKVVITTVATHIMADMAYSVELSVPISPMMCIGTPAKITDKLSIKNVIRHKRCCQL